MARMTRNMKELNMIFWGKEERDGAMWFSRDEFRTAFRTLFRYDQSYRTRACEITLQFEYADEKGTQGDFRNLMQTYGHAIQNVLRSSDVMIEEQDGFTLLLPGMREYEWGLVVDRIAVRLEQIDISRDVTMYVDYRMVEPEIAYLTWLRPAV